MFLSFSHSPLKCAIAGVPLYKNHSKGRVVNVPVERGEARPSPSERALDLPPVPPPPVTVKQLVEDPPTEDTLDGIDGIDGIEGDDSPMTENVPLLSSMRLLVGIKCSWRLSKATMRH